MKIDNRTTDDFSERPWPYRRVIFVEGRPMPTRQEIEIACDIRASLARVAAAERVEWATLAAYEAAKQEAETARMVLADFRRCAIALGKNKT